MDAELVVGGDVISKFHRKALEALTIGPVQFTTAMPDKDGELRIDVELDGTHRAIVRRVHAEEGSKILVSLGSELR